MMRRLLLLLLCALCNILSAAPAAKAPIDAAAAEAERKLADYFGAQTDRIGRECLAEIRTADDWKLRRGESQRQLQEMLGLEPWPERTDLKPVITGVLEQEDFKVEKLHFQASPGLYVTADLYLPKAPAGRLPGILYVCGHSRAVTNGVSFGNKTGYHHHGVWFARNGYVALLIDTVQLGEIQGRHRGTHTENQWWWNSRGYTPAGVEAWFGIRALDYLCSRPEVNPDRIGMTGRSGGGAYTWTVAALDERVKVAAPIAGITDLKNHVLDGAVDGHCDCMFYINTYRWDFPALAALLAPRPLLIGNSDKDRIFPLDGVVRLHAATRRVYELCGAADRLGLLITEGPHADTQDLQLPVFRWFNRWLKGEQPLVEAAAKKCFALAQLRVFDELPADEINTKIQETFVPFKVASQERERTALDSLIEVLLQKVFVGWPDEPAAFKPVLQSESKANGLRCRIFEFSSQPSVSLQLFLVEDASRHKPDRVVLDILDATSWRQSHMRALWEGKAGAPLSAALHDELRGTRSALAFFAPRGIGEPWCEKPSRLTQVRRRFMLLGQTLDGMRVWDIRCAVNALKSLPELKNAAVTLRASGDMGINAAYAGLFEPAIGHLELAHLPQSHMTGPDYLNVLKYTDIPEVLRLLGPRIVIAAQP